MKNVDPVSPQDLMRYLDGELPPEEQRRVQLAMEDSAELRTQLEAFRALRADFHELTFPEREERSVWDRVALRVFRSRAGWFIGAGLGAWIAYGAWVFAEGPVDAWTRVAVGGLAIGVLVLFALVIRDRFRSWADDR